MKRALVKEAKMRAKLGRVSADYAKGRDFQRVYLRSFPAKVAAVVAAAKKLQVGFTDAQVIELAKGIDPFRGTREAVRMYLTPKPGGGIPPDHHLRGGEQGASIPRVGGGEAVYQGPQAPV